jgi:diguanylate cyclase (GGDEF)-like protein/PAS domain S-box-containing protein
MKSDESAGADDGKLNRGISHALAMLVAAAVLPLLLFGLITASLTYSQKKAAAAEELGHAVRALRVAVDRELLGQFQAMEMLAAELGADGADPAAFRVRARRTLEVRQEWRNAALVDPVSQRIVASVKELPPDATQSIAPEEIERVAQRQIRTLAAAFSFGKISRRPVLLLFAPVEHQGRVRFVLTVDLDPRRINDVFAEQRLSAARTGAVLDAGKRIAGRSRDPERYLGVPATPSLAQRVGPAEGGVFSALNQEGQTVYTAFSRSAATGWTVVIGVPTSEFDAPIRRYLIELSLFGGVLLAFGMIPTYAIGSAIVRRRDAFERSMRASRARLQELLRDHDDLLNRIPVGVFKYRTLKDGGHRFEFVSPRLCHLLGVSAEELYRDAGLAFERAGGLDRAGLLRASAEARATLQPFAWEGAMQGPRGKAWLRLESVPTALPNGDVLWNGIQYDITERKRNAEQYRTIVQASLDGFWMTDAAGRILDANEAICRTHGYTREELVGMRIADLEADESQAEIAARTRQIVESGHVQFEARHRCKDGAIINVEVSALYVPDLGERFYAFVRDISERKRTDQQLIESENRLQTIIRLEPECIKIIDEQGMLRLMNPAGLAMIEAESMEQVAGRPVIDLIAPAYRDAYLDLHRRVIGGQGARMEYEIVGLRGGRRWVETSAVPMREHGAVLHLAVTRDVTERKRMEDQVRQLAFHDDLTGLPNRRLLHDRLGRVMSATRRSGRYGAVMFLDLDHFKPLNDAHGHEVGDLLLIEVARRLEQCVRASDTVARFGGDEFVVLLDDLSQDQAESRRQAGAVAEKIRAALVEPYQLPLPRDPAVEIEHRCAASIGVVLFVNHDVSQDDLLKWADATMYRAKEAGRDRVEFYERPG